MPDKEPVLKIQAKILFIDHCDGNRYETESALKEAIDHAFKNGATTIQIQEAFFPMLKTDALKIAIDAVEEAAENTYTESEKMETGIKEWCDKRHLAAATLRKMQKETHNE